MTTDATTSASSSLAAPPAEPSTGSVAVDRYSRQTRVNEIGAAGQQRLAAARVLVCGCGALGSTIAETLARAGVGLLRIVDRDLVEWSNLQRQVLFDEDDVRTQTPKAIAAAHKLRRINSGIQIEPVVGELNAFTASELFSGIDLVVDGLDNFESRYLLNDAALEFQIPWVHGGCVGTAGQVLAIVPHQGPCFRCLLPEPGDPGAGDSCDLVGVLQPAIQMIAALQVVAVMKLLVNGTEATPRPLQLVDAWTGTLKTMDVSNLPRCPACTGERLWLNQVRGTRHTVLCGRNAVQIQPASRLALPLAELAGRWQGHGIVEANRFFSRLTLAESRLQLTVFADGRAIISGTEDPLVAKSLYSRWVGV